MYIVSADQMRKIEKEVIAQKKVTGFELMKTAARGVFNEILKKFDSNIYGKIFTIFCGRGNNGGDGYYIGKLLLDEHARVTLVSLCDTDEIGGDAKMALLEYTASGGEIKDFDYIKNNYSDSCICIVDAVFGTGLSKKLDGIYKEAVAYINSKDAFKVAIDVPSGINADSGQIMGGAVKADLTVTSAFKKLCHVTYPCIENMGELVVCPIGIKDEWVDFENLNYYETDDRLVKRIIPKRKDNSNKGTYGRLMIVAGSRGMSGAACLASKSAMRSGAGLCTLFVPEGIYPIVAAKSDEVMVHPLFETNEGVISQDCEKFIFDKAKSFSAVLMGCGMQNVPDTQKIIRHTVLNLDCPLIIDADGLNALSLDVSVLKQANTQIILTPHPLEMSRLCGLSVNEIEKNRIAIASSFAKEYNVTLVLKGARTVVAGKDGRIFINSTGNSGMATAGSGDVLAGIIASFAAQGFEAIDAATAGVYIHGLAGDAAKEKYGVYAMIAPDITENLGNALKKFE